MKKYSKAVKCDERGQLVIPRDIRLDLNIHEGTGFLLYEITKEGILLKKIESEPLDNHHDILNEIEQKSEKIGIKKDNLKKSITTYQKIKEGNLELI